MNWIYFISWGILVVICINDHIFHGGGLLSAFGQVVRPPNFSPDAIPETSFTCEDKITGGYYADIEADCQLFHVCVQVSEYEFQDFRFLCPNDTVFDQQNLVCTNWFEVDCTQSVQLFAHDFGFRGEKEDPQDDRGSGKGNSPSYDDDYINYDYYYTYEEENNLNSNQQNEQNRFLANSPPATEANRGNPGVGGGLGKLNGFNQNRFSGFPGNKNKQNNNGNSLLSTNGGGGFQINNNNIDGNTGFRRPPIHSTTAIPLGVTRTTSTTRRPKPHVKSNVRLSSRNRNKNTGVKNFLPLLPPSDAPPPSPELFQNEINDDRRADPFRNPPVLSADGKKPRVKSNIKKNRQKHFKGKLNNNAGKKHGNRVVEFNTEHIRFVDPSVNELQENVRNNGFGNIGNTLQSGPEVRPDGRLPRVKSNIKASNNGKRKKNGKPVFTTKRPFFFSPSTRRPLPPTTSPPSVSSFFDQFIPTTPRSSFSNVRPTDLSSPIISNVNLQVEIESDDYFDNTGSFISSTRPPAINSNNAIQFQSVPNVRPTSGFGSHRTKVKSNILAANRNRGNGIGGFRNKETTRGRFNNETPRNSLNNVRPTQQSSGQFFVSTTERNKPLLRPQVQIKTSIPESDEIADYVDEINEFIQPTVTTTTTRRPINLRKRVRPRVKSNILAGRRKKNKRKKNRNRVKPNRHSNIRFTDNTINSIEDDTCDNPFKCPPTKVAARPDGRRPRVKSDIKARRRNYYTPSIRKTNRIQGRPKPKPSRSRANGKQIRTRLRTRKGKAQRRQKAFTKTPAPTTPKPFENNFSADDLNQNQIFPTTTESILSLFLNQIEVENQNKFIDEPTSRPTGFATPLAPPPRPSSPSIHQAPVSQRTFETNSFGPDFFGNNKDINSFPSFPTVSSENLHEPFEEIPQTRFPPRNRPSPVTHSAPPLPTVPSISSLSSSSFNFPEPSTSFDNGGFSATHNPPQSSINLPISSPTRPSFFPTISQPLSVFVNNDDDDYVITSDYIFEYDEYPVSEFTTTTTTTERTTSIWPSTVQPTRFSFSNADFDKKTKRKPRVKSNILQSIRNNGRNKKFKEGFRSNLRFLNNKNQGGLSNLKDKVLGNDNQENLIETTTGASLFFQPTTAVPHKRKFVFSTDNLIDSKPSVRPDGRAPRVKSNIKARISAKGKSLTKHKVNIDHLSKQSDKNLRVGKSVVTFENTDNVIDYDTEPEVRPDGQKPHVKSNIRAAAKFKASNDKSKQGIQGHNSFKHSKKVITTRRPKFIQSLFFNNGRSNITSFSVNNSSVEKRTETDLKFHRTTTPPSTTSTKGSISTSTTPTVITTTSMETTRSPFGSTVPSILGAFLNTLNTRAIDPTLSSKLNEANAGGTSRTSFRASSPLPLSFAALLGRSETKEDKNRISVDIKSNESKKTQKSKTKTLISDSDENSNTNVATDDFDDYYEDYYDAAYEYDNGKKKLKKRSYTATQANAAITAAAASAQV